jgi:hypothetical protein
VKIEADVSYGNIVHPLKEYAAPAQLSWQWRIEKPLEDADLREARRRRHGGQGLRLRSTCRSTTCRSPTASCCASPAARRASRCRPATVCYVWDPKLPAGTTLDNAFTRRMRYIVLEVGNDRLDKWVAKSATSAPISCKLFRDESTTVPPIVGIAVGADSDNTKSHSVAYVSGIALEP